VVSDNICDFPNVIPNYLQIGKSRRILNHTFISMSKILYANPQPEFVGVDDKIASVRKQFFKKRSTKNRYGSDWAPEIASAYLDGDSLGVGFVQIGLTETDQKTQRVNIKYVPATQVIWDRHNINPEKSRFIGFIHYLPEDIAIQKFGQQMWDLNHRTQFIDTDSLTPIRSLRIIEYYDLGWAGQDPTYSVIINDFNGEFIKHEKNPFGTTLPFAVYTNWIPPGSKMPIGRIMMQISTQEALNELEDNMRTTIVRGVPFDLIDKSSIDPQDYEEIIAGENLAKVGYNPGSGSPIVRVPGAEVPQTLLAYQGYLERVLSTESGLTDLDRSNTFSTVKSATEISLLNSSSQIQGSWSRKQLAIFYKQIIENVFEIAILFDREPLIIDIDGKDYVMNNPDDPQSWIEFWLQDQAEIVIDETSLDYKDAEQEKLKKLAVLGQINAEVQAGLIDPIAFANAKLEILGLDPNIFLKKQEPAPGPEQMPQVPPELMAMLQQQQQGGM
jgi:hypothetical protein